MGDSPNGRAKGRECATTLREAEPLTEALHTFFPELNPILSYFNFHQQTIAGFITNAGADIAADYGTGQRGQAQMGIIEGRSFEGFKYDGRIFPYPRRGVAPLREAPRGFTGSKPATDPDPRD